LLRSTYLESAGKAQGGTVKRSISKAAKRAKPNNRPKSAKRRVTSLSPSERLAVSVYTACDMTSLGLSSIWSQIRKREIEVIHVGKRCLVLVASLHAFIERQAAMERGRYATGEPASLARGHKSASSALAE
jgi:hypothetical protein